MKRDNNNNYTSPSLSFTTLDLEGFLCDSRVEYDIYVDEDENMGETDIDIINMP